MISKRTVIGIAVGSVIVAIAIASLITHFGIQTIQVDETFRLGESTSYRLNAPNHTPQTMKITGNTFNVTLSSPGGGLHIPLTTHKNEVTFDWVHLADGDSRIDIQNTGDSEIRVEATFQVTTDPIFFTYDIMVIISGLVIMGLSLGFSVRKPRGF